MADTTDLERAVLEKLLDGEHPVLQALRAQLEVSEVSARTFTGVGFFTTFKVPPQAPAAPVKAASLAFGDVVATIPGVQHGAGFVLFIKDGRLDTLEGYTYDEDWPESIPAFELDYVGSTGTRDLSALDPHQHD